jgi:hypothetical protein
MNYIKKQLLDIYPDNADTQEAEEFFTSCIQYAANSLSKCEKDNIKQFYLVGFMGLRNFYYCYRSIKLHNEILNSMLSQSKNNIHAVFPKILEEMKSLSELEKTIEKMLDLNNILEEESEEDTAGMEGKDS